MARPESDPLIAGLIAGSEEAFAALFDRFAPSVLRVAQILLTSRHDAEDVVQEVFVGIVRVRHTLGRVKNLRAYLFTSLRRAAAKRLAERNRERCAPLSDRAEPEPRGADLEWSVQLERAVRSLPTEQRELLALKVEGQLAFAEIGELLGISPNTAASRYRYALEKLRAILEGVKP
jgi:RNA polymerase sigma-70 factor (ECF subfamily)